jgi:hypothetical protein
LRVERSKRWELGALDVTLGLPPVIGDELDGLRDAARQNLVLYTSFPFFQYLFRASGFAAEADAMEKGAGLAALSDELLDSFCLIGPIERCPGATERVPRRRGRPADPLSPHRSKGGAAYDRSVPTRCNVAGARSPSPRTVNGAAPAFLSRARSRPRGSDDPWAPEADAWVLSEALLTCGQRTAPARRSTRRSLGVISCSAQYDRVPVLARAVDSTRRHGKHPKASFILG